MTVAARRMVVPAEFRLYLLEGEHWRFGRRVRGEVARYAGLALHRTGTGLDGQEGPRQFTAAFLEYLEQAAADARAERAWGAACARWRRVEEALAAVGEDRPDEIEAVRYYLVPAARRRHAPRIEAELRGYSPDAWRDQRDRGIALVWADMGGVW